MQRLFLSIAVSALAVTGALAHSPVVAPEPATPAPTYSSADFDWDGFYMGLGITGSALVVDGTTFKTGYLDLIAGVNMTAGSLLFGLEGWVGGFSGDWSNGFGGGAQARLGVLASPEVLLYLSGGGYTDTVDQYGTVGAGVELAVTDNVSVDFEYKYWAWSTSGMVGNSIGASANFHF